MYTASRPRVLLAQQLAWRLTRALGARVLPGTDELLRIDGWDELTEAWRETLGEFDSVSAYHRKDTRRGATLLGCRGGRAVALVKVRDDPTGPRREQELLAHLARRPIPGVRVPGPLGWGSTASGLTWAAQEFVFERPHRPVHALADTTLAALTASLTEAFDTLGSAAPTPGWVPAHHDLTPWNLRRDHRGAVWLFDWEDATHAPAGADRDYLAITSAALTGGPAPTIDEDNRRYWADRVAGRVAAGHELPINRVMLRLLGEDRLGD